MSCAFTKEPSPNAPKGYKRLQGGVKKMRQIRLRYRRGLLWAPNRCLGSTTPEWRAVGGQCFVVREVPGSNPRGALFDPVSEEIV